MLATILFADIVGSTRHATLLAAFHAETRRAIARFRGHEVKTTGDGFLAAFDGPARAVRCAAAVRDDARALGLELRAGIHTGECEQDGDDLVGIGVHIAARLMVAAEPGAILASGTVGDLVVGAGIEFESRGEPSCATCRDAGGCSPSGRGEGGRPHHTGWWRVPPRP